MQMCQDPSRMLILVLTWRIPPKMCPTELAFHCLCLTKSGLISWRPIYFIYHGIKAVDQASVELGAFQYTTLIWETNIPTHKNNIEKIYNLIVG